MSNPFDAAASEFEDDSKTPVFVPPSVPKPLAKLAPADDLSGASQVEPAIDLPISNHTPPENNPNNIIEVHDVYRSFGKFMAVSGSSLSVKKGSVTALIGPNGSGKTTLMLMMVGLLAPDAGSIKICGFDPQIDNYAVRSKVGWMPDQFGMWETLTCHEALISSGATYRLSKEESLRKADELLELVHLTEFRDKPAHVLSRGQKQRLGLARALMHSPELLILDEPANGLDPRSRIELRTIVRNLAEQGTTVLISSHVLAELDEMVDAAIFISGGRTVAQETVHEARQARTNWQVRALDRTLLVNWLDSIHIAFAQSTDGSALVNIAGEQNAARFIRDAVNAGVPIVEFRPQSGALESTYLALNEERR